MSLNFRNRIAFHYLIATAVLVALVFGLIFFIVKGSVYRNLDADLSFEAKKHSGEIEINDGRLQFNNKSEWEEHEHREVQVNPVFIQLVDARGRVMDKSPNLKEAELPFKLKDGTGEHLDTKLENKEIRMVQIPVTDRKGEVVGYILAAMTLEPARIVLENLRKVLLLSFVSLLVVLFFVSRYLAGRSISPIRNITETAKRITRFNLSQRVELPSNKDELYELSASINELLERMERAVKRERQFTSDASHELRTPLSTLRGTLEVLIRKDRSVREYVEKIKVSLGEIDRMAKTIEQLLLLARMDKSNFNEKENTISINDLLNRILKGFEPEVNRKKLQLTIQDNEAGKDYLVPEYFAALILENTIGNAIKYSVEGGKVEVSSEMSDNALKVIISDEGIGIKEDDLTLVFNPLFRSDALLHKEIQGNGLGLSIASRAATAIGAEIHLDSQIGKGTTVTLLFK